MNMYMYMYVYTCTCTHVPEYMYIHVHMYLMELRSMITNTNIYSEQTTSLWLNRCQVYVHNHNCAHTHQELMNIVNILLRCVSVTHGQLGRTHARLTHSLLRALFLRPGSSHSEKSSLAPDTLSSSSSSSSSPTESSNSLSLPWERRHNGTVYLYLLPLS